MSDNNNLPSINLMCCDDVSIRASVKYAPQLHFHFPKSVGVRRWSRFVGGGGLCKRWRGIEKEENQADGSCVRRLPAIVRRGFSAERENTSTELLCQELNCENY